MTKKFESYDIRHLFNAIPIKDIMITSVPIVDEEDDLSEVAMIFLTRGVSHVCVVDPEKKLVGLISQKYLYKTRSPQKILPGEQVEFDKNTLIDGDSFYDRKTLDGYILKDIMEKVVSTLKPEDKVSGAILLMARLNIDCIPVTDKDRKVRGILKENHIIKLTADIISGY